MYDVLGNVNNVQCPYFDSILSVKAVVSNKLMSGCAEVKYPIFSPYPTKPNKGNPS